MTSIALQCYQLAPSYKIEKRLCFLNSSFKGLKVLVVVEKGLSYFRLCPGSCRILQVVSLLRV